MTTTAAPPDPLLDVAATYLDRLDVAQHELALATDVSDDIVSLVDDLSEHLLRPHVHQASDPYLSASLLAALLAGERSLRDSDPDRRRRAVRLALEQVRQVLRDLLDEAPTSDDTDPASVLRFIVDTVHVPQHDLADLLGVHVRTLQRWLKGEARPDPEDEDRTRMVARTVVHLRHTYTSTGMVRWFMRVHESLDGMRPVDLLKDPLEAARLPRLAARSRSTIAS